METEHAGSEGGHRDGLSINVDGTGFTVHHPEVSGRQVLEIAGKKPPEDFIVYWLDKENVLHDLGLSGTVHLHLHKVERFLTFRSDRSFRFEIDGKREDWGCAIITEETIRKLAGVGQDAQVWLERKGEPDLLIARGQQVDLSAPGIERFHTERLIIIKVFNEDDGHEIAIDGRPQQTVGQIIDEMYAKLGVQRRPDDRLRCEEGGADVYPFASLTLRQYVKEGHCRCLTWLFAGGTGGAACR